MWMHELMARYSALIVFLNVFGSSLGLPLLATPTLVMAGAGVALAADNAAAIPMHFGLLVGAAVIGGALADLVWFQRCRQLGTRVPQGAGRLASILRHFDEGSVRMLVVARFVPGLTFLSVLLCGAKSVRLRAFVLHDCAGIGLWALAALTAGALSASQIGATLAIGAP